MCVVDRQAPIAHSTLRAAVWHPAFLPSSDRYHLHVVAKTFIAIKIPATRQLRHLLDQLGRLGRAVRPVVAENLHLTLRFLGETDEARFASIFDTMRVSVETCDPFELTLSGLGAFPAVHRPSVIWVGAKQDSSLPQIVDRLEQRLNELGLPPQDKPWSAHVTLARVKEHPPVELFDLLRSNSAASFGVVPVSSVDLMTSTLRPTGPLYSVAASVSLG